MELTKCINKKSNRASFSESAFFFPFWLKDFPCPFHMEHPAILTSGTDEALGCSLLEKESVASILANISAW